MRIPIFAFALFSLGVAACKSATPSSGGTVNGLTPLRFVTDPIGGNRASVSQEITVLPGDTVVLTVPPI